MPGVGVLPPLSPSSSSKGSTRRPRRQPQLAASCNRWTSLVRGGEEVKGRFAGSGANVAALLSSVASVSGEDRDLESDHPALRRMDTATMVPPPSSYAAIMGQRRNAHVGSLCFTSPVSASHRLSVATSMRSSIRSSSASSDADSTCLARGLPEVVAEVREAVEEFLNTISEEDEDPPERPFREARYTEALLAYPGVEEAFEKHGLHEPAIMQDVARLFAECDASISGYVPQPDATTIFRGMGREVPTKVVFETLERLSEQKYGLPRRDDLDFLDVVELVGFQVTRDNDALRKACEKLRGLERPVKLTELARAIEPMNLHPRLEQLRRIAGDLKILGKNESSVEFTQTDQMLKIAAQCRELEKQRAQQRAGFSHEQVCFFQDAFERVAGSIRGELDREGVCEVLTLIQALPENPEELRDLEELMVHADTNENGTWSFDECLHLVRRFHDKEEYVAVAAENDAASEAGLSHEELHSLRGLYLGLLDDGEEFSYYSLTKAVRLILGASITVDQNAVLQGVFRELAIASKAAPPKPRRVSPRKSVSARAARPPPSAAEEPTRIEALQLTLPGFLRLIGRLWQEDLLSNRPPRSRLSSTFNMYGGFRPREALLVPRRADERREINVIRV